MANPYFVYISTYAGVAAAGQSSTVAFSYANTAGFEAWIPIQVQCPNTSNVSAGAVVFVQRSTDGGASFETFPDAAIGVAFSLPTANQISRKDLLLRDPGIFIITVQTGYGAASTWSINYGATIAQITAYA